MAGRHAPVLVVDDDNEIRAVVSEYLQGIGFDVAEAENGLEALLKVKRLRPRAVILDINMPRLGGLDALKRIRAFDPTIDVVVVTGDLTEDLKRRARAMGAAGVFAKPVSLADLRAAVGEPPVPDRSAGAADNAISPLAESSSGARSTCVLVVDDDPEVRAALEEFLRQSGYTSRMAADGASGLRAIRDDPPAVVLLDIHLPGLGGLEVLQAVRATAPGVLGHRPQCHERRVTGSTSSRLRRLRLCPEATQPAVSRREPGGRHHDAAGGALAALEVIRDAPDT